LPAESDRRSVLARITPAGRRAAEEATRRLTAERFGTQPLSDRRCQELFRVLEPFRRQAGDFS
jgi:DNA-binding MarR family transcriptional regulator